MHALLLSRYKHLEVADLPIPSFEPEDVLVQVAACGICGSDVHGYDGASGRRIPPIIMRHKAAGIVTVLGSQVDDFRIGDRVTFDSSASCGHYEFCLHGEVSLCDNRQTVGVSCSEVNRAGDFAKYLDGPIVFLASESSRYITGQTLLVDGGIYRRRPRHRPGPKFQANPSYLKHRKESMSLHSLLRQHLLRIFLIAISMAGFLSTLPAQQTTSTQDKLQIYFVDVEGGQATLFVTPSHESLLIDTGWPGHAYRDADRIAAAAKNAGISKIDYVLITHFHDDHVGGVPQLVERIPVGTFIDHGPNRELDKGVTEHGFAAYQKVLTDGHNKRMIAHPGDVLPIDGIIATVISADGDVIKQPLPDTSRPNEFCKTAETRPVDQTENARSLGVQITFGALKLLDLGDLTWDKELQLVCPTNRIGPQDIYIVSHHGWLQSSSPAMVDALHARVAIMDNGEAKGGSLPTLKTIAAAPGLETLWQLHASAEGGPSNTAPEYIANPLDTDAGYYLKLTASSDGSFDILNARTAVTRHYATR